MSYERGPRFKERAVDKEFENLLLRRVIGEKYQALSITRIIDSATLSDLDRKAETSTRRRSHLVLHPSDDSGVQRVIMSVQPDSYVCPHRHPDKTWEMLMVISGALDVLLFQDDGTLESRHRLTACGDPMIEYAADRFHSAVVVEPNTRVLEIKEGPYNPETAKEIPRWAIPEGSVGVKKSLQQLRMLAPGEQVA